DGLEARAEEELLRTELSRLPDHVEPADAAAAGLLGESLDREGTDATALVVGVDVDAPEDRLELLVLGVGVEVAHDEAHDVLAVEHDALPRGGGVGDGGRGRVRHGSDELLLAGLQ